MRFEVLTVNIVSHPRCNTIQPGRSFPTCQRTLLVLLPYTELEADSSSKMASHPRTYNVECTELYDCISEN